MYLNHKESRRLWFKRRLRKCPNGQVMVIFGRSPKKRIFGKSAKGGPREIFQKIAQKQPSFETPKSTLALVALSSNWCAHILQRLEKILVQTAAPKLPKWPSYCNFCKVIQNPHFLKKCKGGTKGNFLKIAQKSSPRLKSPKPFWRKWHYALIKMRLYC